MVKVGLYGTPFTVSVDYGSWLGKIAVFGPLIAIGGITFIVWKAANSLQAPPVDNSGNRNGYSYAPK